MSEKRKEFTPKKREASTSSKRQTVQYVDLTLDDRDETTISNAATASSRNLFCEVKMEDEVVVDVETPTLTDHYRNNRRLPIYSNSSPDLEEIFRICLLGSVPEEYIVKEKPTRVKDTVTFVIKQDKIKLRHPYDLEADDIGGAYIKNDQVRFYQVKVKDGELDISTEVRVTKNSKGDVTGGTYNRRKDSGWQPKIAKFRRLYAVVRKRAVHKETLKEHSSAFTRYITYVMPVDEYNSIHGKLKALKEHQLSLNVLILHYYFNTGYSVPIVPAKHGNSSKNDTAVFRPTQHSLKQECKEAVYASNPAPRILAESLGEDISILERTTDAGHPRNAKQISNYKYLYGQSNSKERQDDVSDLILQILEQRSDKECFVLDDDQPFVRELLCRNGSQPSVVAFTDQTLKDIERFCTHSSSQVKFSPLLVDTTFNIAEYYFTQTAYENFSLRMRDSDKHPWFPGPILVHRNKSKENFSYFWQAVKRGNQNLKNLHALSTDEDEGLSGGILDETIDTIHLLGLEHVKGNIDKKLTEMNFPVQQRRVILSDCFGGRSMGGEGCLYESESGEEFDRKCIAFKKKWEDLEREYTTNNPLRFTKYFTKYKQNQIRNKMTRYVRDRAGVERGFGQNPIEWLHYMSKSEINDVAGTCHRDVRVTTALEGVKGRILRMYRDAAKALYGEGPYRLTNGFSKYALSYDDWEDFPPQERKAFLKRFFRDVTRSSAPSAMENEPMQTDQMEEEYLAAPSRLTRTRRVTVNHEDFGIAEIIPDNTIKDMIRRAEALLNEPGAIMPAASNDSRVRTVRSRHSKAPLIVQPSRTGNLFECTCTVYKASGLCQDTIAVASDLECLDKYVEEVKKKFSRKKGGGVNLTIAYNSRRGASEQGMKLNEIRKAATRKKNTRQESWVPEETIATQEGMACDPHAQIGARSQSAFVPPSVSPSQTCQAQNVTPSTGARLRTGSGHAPEQQHLSQLVPLTNVQQEFSSPLPPSAMGPYAEPFSQYLPHEQSRNSNFMPQQPQQFPWCQATGPSAGGTSGVQQQCSGYVASHMWNSSLSPFKYEICFLPNSVKKCYGCNQEFAAKYRNPPFNVVIRHADRRIRGTGPDGSIRYSADFTNTYYHCDLRHIKKKNPYFDGCVCLNKEVNLSPEQQDLIISAGLSVVTI